MNQSKRTSRSQLNSTTKTVATAGQRNAKKDKKMTLQKNRHLPRTNRMPSSKNRKRIMIRRRRANVKRSPKTMISKKK